MPVRRLLRLAGAAVSLLAGTLFDRITTPRSTFNVLLARRSRRAFERLGPTFVKAGQLMSSSPGVFPKPWVDELAHCRDDVRAASWKRVSRLIRHELGERYRHLLDLDPVPLAAGSMAQVHAAHLADGTPVVVKVQRPNLYGVLVQDVCLLRLAVRLARRLRPSLSAANLDALVDDFAAGLDQQLSFGTEIANLERMRVALSGLPVRIPRVWKSLSSERVLVMERLDGVRIDDLAAIDALSIDRSTVVTTVAETLIVPALAKGVFHNDMHAGNMLVLPDGSLGLLDFGVIGRLEGTARRAASDLLAAVVNCRVDDVLNAILRLVDTRQIDLAAIAPDVQALIATCLDRPLGEIDVPDTLRSILALAVRHSLVLPEALVGLFKQIMYLDGVCRTLDPEFDLLGDGAAIIDRARARSQWFAGAFMARLLDGSAGGCGVIAGRQLSRTQWGCSLPWFAAQEHARNAEPGGRIWRQCPYQCSMDMTSASHLARVRPALSS